MQENVFIHFLETNFCKNAPITCCEEDEFQCAMSQGIDKKVSSLKNFPCHQINPKAPNCLQQRQKALQVILEKYTFNTHAHAPIYDKTIHEIYTVLNHIKHRLRTCQTFSDLTYMSEKLVREIHLNTDFTHEDRYDLELFINCMEELYKGDMHRSIQFACSPK